MLALALTALKSITPRTWLMAIALSLASGTILTHLHNDDKRVTAAFVAGGDAALTSVATINHSLTDSLHGVIALRESALAEKRADADSAWRAYEDRKTKSKAATDALYASMQTLSEPAQADPTVQRLENAAVALQADRDTILQNIVKIGITARAERNAAIRLHMDDSLALTGMTQRAAVSTLRWLQEAKRPKRTWKSNAVLVAVGAAGVPLVRFVANSVRHK